MDELTPDQLAKLSRTEKLKLIDLIEERERRRREAADVYEPHRAQKEIHASKKQIRALFCGNGFGKTTCGANEAIWALKGFNPVRKEFMPTPSRGIIVLDNPSKVDDVWIPELRKWSNFDDKQFFKRGKPYITQIKEVNGSEALFMFHEQNPLQFESIEADWIIFDEPPPRKIYIALMRGLRKAGSKPWILILGTPITAAWMRKEIYEPWARGTAPHIECFKFRSDENRDNLNWDMMEKVFFNTLSEKELAVRRDGSFFDLEGLALAHVFDRSTHVIDSFLWPRDWPCIVAIDPHPSKDHIACLVGVGRDGELYYIDELASSSAPQEFARELREFYKGYRVIDIICDSLGNTPGTGGAGNATFIEIMNQAGNRVRATSYKDKNDEDFIQRIQQVLEIPKKADNFGRRQPKLRVFQGNNGIVSDIENVEWLTYKNQDFNKPKLNITNRDYLATLKYALAASPELARIKSKTLKSSRGTIPRNKRAY